MFLTERQKRILLAIVRKYMDDGEPVSSGFVTSQLGNDLSSATIRNEMAELGSMGYLQQPHVSAGRVPTVLAYHMYICLLYTSDAADDLLCVDLGGRRIIKKKKKTNKQE